MASKSLITNGGQSILSHQQHLASKLTKYVPQRLPPMPAVNDLLKLYQVRATKHLSQNFLLDPRITQSFVRVSGISPGSTVVEIGPGPGTLTRKILEQGPSQLFVIEKDRRFLPMLEMLADAAHPGQMKIMLGDVLDYSLEGLFSPDLRRQWDDNLPPIYLIGNLPYNISTVLLIRWLRQMYNRTGPFSYGRVRLTLSFQLEVAKRITAPVLNFYRSRLSVMSQLFAHVKIKKKIKGESFVPSPLVDTGVVKFVPRVRPLISDVPFDVIEKFLRIYFNNRNAYLSKSIKYLFPARLQSLTFEMFDKAEIDPTCTATMLDNEEIVRLIRIFWQYCQQHPQLMEYDFRQVKREPKLIRTMFHELGGSQRLIDAAVRREFFELPLMETNKVLQ